MKSGLLASLALAVGLIAGAAQAEKLVVGAYPANPPWEFKNEQSQFEGFEVDMVNEIAARMGREVEISDLGFQALFAATASGRIDLAISTISITNERLQSQSFTQGYYDADLSLISTTGGVKSLADMKGQPIGAIASSTGDAWIQANTAAYGFGELRTYPDQQGLLLDVKAGRIAGAIGDVTGFIFAIKQMPDLAIAEVIPTGDRYGIMLTKGSPLLEQVNAAITAMKADGTMATIYERWLGEPPRAGSSTVTELPIPVAQ
ncbi:MAG: ABC transporter substrate-binding protein [Gemmobacter sp.]|jgi:polar amino acid transport system substrate-binding protein|nr:ABC transporter substrate-binding protein [Gemmobacter sp.]